MEFSSSDEDILDLVYLANVQKNRRFWVHPLWLKKRKTVGTFDVIRELYTCPDRFQNFYTMFRECFQNVLALVRGGIEKRSTNWGEPICPEERLLITLRQLGSPSIMSETVDLTPTEHKEHCMKLDYFAEQQKELCSKYTKILPILGMGARLAIEECQNQFSFSRWNCTTFQENNNTFGNVVSFRSREAAYLSAISAASVAYAVTRACSKGDLAEYCSCDNKINKRKSQKFKWGGCSDDIKYGEMFSSQFLDVREDRSTALGLMNLHNNEAGRRGVRSRMQKTCKCHGVSGSCSMQICWRRLPTFKAVAEGLFQRYEGASHVRFKETKKKERKLRAMSKDMKKPKRTDLVYLDESPDYCEKNDVLNILGTHGRICNRTSHGMDGCRLLCCGRGYQTRVREVEEKCNCRFVWCCNVVCDICRSRKEEHVCN